MKERTPEGVKDENVFDITQGVAIILMVRRGRGRRTRLAVLANPSVSYTGVDGTPNVLGEVSGKRLRVCYEEEERRLLIVTVVNRGRA